MSHPLDAPFILSNIFFPRRAMPNSHPDKENVKDGLVEVDEGIRLGYRFYMKDSLAPVLLYFHGNGEVASDYDSFARYYHEAGLSLLVIDYRGYGWSGGSPLVSRLLPDAQAALDKIATIFKEVGIVPERPLFLKGRSLGSAPATFLAKHNPDKFKGLIIESGFANAPSLFIRLGIPIPNFLPDMERLPISNSHKMKAVTLPLLLIHGEVDTLIPLEQGKELYEASPIAEKQMLIIKGAGHNDIAFKDARTYFGAIKSFVEKYS